MASVRAWLVALLLGCGWLAVAHAGPDPVVLQTRDGGVPLVGRIGYVIDEGARLNLDSLRTLRGSERFDFPEKLPTLGGNAHPVWLLMRVEQHGTNGDWVLSSSSTGVQDMRFYGPFDARGKALQDAVLTGSLLPFETRPLSSERLALRMQLRDPGIYTVYVRAVSLTPRKFDFKVWDIEDFNTDGQDKRLFDGLCYGILVAMLVYNLVLLLVFRDRTYALYVLSGALALLTLLSFNGHAAHYLFAQSPVLADRGNVVFPSLWIVFGSLFAYSFLDLHRYAPTAGRLVLGVVMLALCGTLLGTIGQQTVAQAFNEYVSLLGTVVVFCGAVLSWYRGFSPARWYIAGQLALFASVFVTVMINWGYLQWPFMEDNGLQIGVATEVMVFAVALSSRIRLMQAMQVELKTRTEHLTRVSETDPLTGVANRTGLANRTDAILRQPYERTLILLDLDKFKPINDLYGHEAGDAVLVEIARRIQALLRNDDTVARVGGDEFVVVLHQALTRTVVEQIAARLLEAIAQPVVFAGQALSVGGSLGIARYPGNGLTLPDLMQAADVAMYHIKRNGRAGYAFFDDLSDQDAQSAAQSVAGAAHQASAVEIWEA